MLPNRPTLTLCSWTTLACLLFVSSVAATASAQEEKKPEDSEKATVTAKKLVTNLLNPSGLAVHAGTGHVFIANRHGVFRFLPNEEDRKKRIVMGQRVIHDVAICVESTASGQQADDPPRHRTGEFLDVSTSGWRDRQEAGARLVAVSSSLQKFAARDSGTTSGRQD